MGSTPPDGVERLEMRKRHAVISMIRNIDMVGVRLFSRLIPKLLIPFPRNQYIIRTNHGFDLWIDPVKDSGVERSLYYTGTYEMGTLYLLGRLLREGDVYVDVGANIGLMTVYAAKTVGMKGKVLAIEPNPNTRDMLSFNVRINDLKNVNVIPYAIGSVEKEASIHDHPDNNRGKASLIRPEGSIVAHPIKVMRLDELLKDERPIRLLKLDIEGYELEALKGMGDLLRHNDRPILMIECSGKRENSHGLGTKAIHDHLEACGGYRYFMPSKGKERKSVLVELMGQHEFPEHDNVYCMTTTHVDELKDHGVFERLLK